ncbi:hypothetical protein Tcan_02372 [Toxocara canis]|uniref:Uncharacterized protein n=1 Tax=Toxocara canis TaxID=6265 RepID=A0A0B2UQ20_TOXCA|nr:hypothetical protein Tcan_02372 [Toxocara canis]
MARRSIARNAFMKVRSTSIRATSPANEKVPSKIYRLLARIGASVGIFCTPIVFFDTIGYPASVVGTSMEVCVASRPLFLPISENDTDEKGMSVIIF